MHLVIISLNDIFWSDYVGIIGSTLIYIYLYFQIFTKLNLGQGVPFLLSRWGVCVAGGGMYGRVVHGGGGHALGEGLHGGGCMAGETATKRAVRILLESILVLHNLCTMCRFNKKWKKRGKLFTRKHAYRLLCLTIATRCHHWGTLYSEVFKWTSVTGIRSWLPEVTSGGEGPCTVRSHVCRRRGRGSLYNEVPCIWGWGQGQGEVPVQWGPMSGGGTWTVRSHHG